jgi:hypothetical protein
LRHFEFRHLWYDGIKTIDEVEHFLPGVGSRHWHVLKNGKIEMMYISSFGTTRKEKPSSLKRTKKTNALFTLLQKGQVNIAAG